MFCPKCGKINPDSNEVCSGCNADLREEIENKAPEKKINWGRIIIAAVIIIVAAVVVTIALSGCGTMDLPEESITF